MARRLRNQTIREEINTEGANSYARNLHNSPDDVKLNWWEMFSTYRIKKWRQELKDIVEKTDVTFEYICEYLGAEYSGRPGFYKKMPKCRETYIGIGMACGMPLSTINRWIVKYGGKRRLYVKDALNDLVWIFLINVNFKNRDSAVNYYQKYEECQSEIEEIYNSIVDEADEDYSETVTLEDNIEALLFDSEYNDLKKFVKDNIAAFKSAYRKPKKYLNRYVKQILRVENENRTKGRCWTLNTLRGYLDDSMINYLTTGTRYVPKNKRTHIAIALALGMTTDDINEYLDLLGYAHLDGTHDEEGVLMNLLDKWEAGHPFQRIFKDRYIKGEAVIFLEKEEELQAVSDMLKLRSEIKEMYDSFVEHTSIGRPIKKFPYMNE